ncbi:MAG TPA: glycosyltransferase [Chloroflexaceae bacterium]|mgnify:CR=1 FL=1|nr:glycosyltransferase [Chloroflexaceae bacterium]
MTTRVTTIELGDPLPTIPLPPGATGLLALLRRGGRPVGLVWLRDVAGEVRPAQLRAAIAAQAPAGQADPAPPVAPAAEEPLSIVVCTHERPDDLERCLEALAPLAARGHELIVVDNAPRGARTAEVAARFPARYLREPRPGLDHARNLGLRAATRPIVAYTDDDAVPDPCWAAALQAPFGDPAVGCVTGLVLPLELETPAQEQFEVYCAHRRDFQARVLAAPATPPAAGGVAGMGANMAFRRELLLRLGGFDPRLDGGRATRSGGDTDMFARVLEAGARIVYTPDALVWHRHRRTDAELRSCIYGYGVGLYSFLTKRLVEGRDAQALVIGARWLVGPVVKGLWRRLRGRAAVPASLLLLELAGAFEGPLAYARESWAARSGGGL